jgi:hypothetical protein
MRSPARACFLFCPRAVDIAPILSGAAIAIDGGDSTDTVSGPSQARTCGDSAFITWVYVVEEKEGSRRCRCSC